MRTYTIIFDPTLQINRLTEKYLREFFDEKEWKYVEGVNYADFVYVTTVSNEKEAWNIKCILKNMMSDDKKAITDKCRMHYLLKEKYPEYTKKHVPDTVSLSDFKMPDNGGVYIVRPCGRGFYSGKNVYIIENNRDLEKVKKEYNYIHSKKKKEFDVLVSNYITNPLLFHGKKFHFRTYLLVGIYPEYNFHVFNMAKIITAKKKYIKSNFKDKDIHDSHMGSTDANYYFPKHYPYDDVEHVANQIVELSTQIAKIYKKYAGSYPESKYAYEVYGLDLMLDENHNLYFIELNDRVGMTPPDDKYDDEYNNFFYKYMKWTYINGIKPVFDALDKKK